jgi:hypothetical protein
MGCQAKRHVAPAAGIFVVTVTVIVTVSVTDSASPVAHFRIIESHNVRLSWEYPVNRSTAKSTNLQLHTMSALAVMTNLILTHINPALCVRLRLTTAASFKSTPNAAAIST